MKNLWSMIGREERWVWTQIGEIDLMEATAQRAWRLEYKERGEGDGEE